MSLRRTVIWPVMGLKAISTFIRGCGEAKALAFEDHEAVEHAVDRVVIDARELHRGALFGQRDGCRPVREASLEKRVRARVEQLAAPGGQAKLAVGHAEEDGAEQRDEPAVGPEAQVHRLGMRACIIGQALVEPEHTQVFGVGRVLDWDQALVLGVQREDEPQDELLDELEVEQQEQKMLRQETAPKIRGMAQLQQSNDNFAGAAFLAQYAWELDKTDSQTRLVYAYTLFGAMKFHEFIKLMEDHEDAEGLRWFLSQAEAFKDKKPLVSEGVEVRELTGKCSYPTIFYLFEEDEKLQDIKKVCVSDVSRAISNNVKVLNETMKKYSNDVVKLKELQTTLDILLRT